MFKRFKDRLNEVSEEVKRDPRFVNGIASVNQLAQQTYSALNKNEKTGSRESLASNASFTPSFSQLQSLEADPARNDPGGHKRSLSSDLQAYFDSEKGAAGLLSASASSPSISSMAVAGNNSFFSLTEDDDAVLSGHNSPTKNASPAASGGMRSRRLSSSSMTSEAANLFPIYESPLQAFSLPVNDLDSTAGSEWDDEGASSTQHLSSISKEQLFQMLQKSRARYHKYKGRYADVVKAYQDLERENGKVKTVMQQTQDKALRRISELREQSLLEQKAKRHLEEELRSELEEKQHVIEALQTKVTLLRSGGKNVIDDNEATTATTNGGEEDSTSNLVDLSDPLQASDGSVIQRDAEKVSVLEEKIKRLEGLLTKCKESIKANKQKTTALTEVKESLAKQVGEREKEMDEVRSQLLSTQATLTSAQKEIDGYRKREQQEELQIAEIKMMMHQEIITKDEEIGKLRGSLKEVTEIKEEKELEITKLQDDLESLKKQQDALEKSLESEKASVLQEMSRGKSSALQALQLEMEKRISELGANHEKEKSDLIAQLNEEMNAKLQTAEREKQRELTLKNDELSKKLAEKEEEGRLAVEELELRLASLTAGEGSKAKLLQDLENKLKASAVEKQTLQNEQARLKEELNSVCSQIRSELKNELGALQEKNLEVQMYLDQATKQLAELTENHENEKRALQNEIDRLRNDLSEGIESESESVRELQEAILKLSSEKEMLAKSALVKDKELANVNSTLKAIEEELEKQTSAFKQLDDDHQSATQVQENYRLQLQENREKIVALENVINKYELMHKENLEDADKAKVTISDLQEELEKKKLALSEMQLVHQESLGALQAQMESSISVKSEESSDKFQMQLNLMQEENAHKLNCLETEKEELLKSLEKLRNEVADCKMKSASKDETLLERERAIQGYEEQKQEMAEEVATKEAELVTSAQKIESLNAQLANLAKENEETQEKLQEAIEKSSNLERELNAANAHNESLVEQVELAQMKLTETNEIRNQVNNLQLAKSVLEKAAGENGERIARVENALKDERSKNRELQLQLDLLQSELSEQNQNQATLLTDYKRRVSELEKEIMDVKNREASLKDNEQNMISYQKELQERIDSFEKREEHLSREIQQLQETIVDLNESMERLKLEKVEEINKLKADLEIKMRLEREKKNSYKELQVQSIEYQKKLQDQLTAMESELEESRKNASNYEKEANLLSEKLEELAQQLSDAQTERDIRAAEIIKKKEEIDELISSAHGAKRDLEQQIEALSTQNQDLLDKLKVSSNSAEHDNLIAHLQSSHEKEKEDLSTQLSQALSSLSTALETEHVFSQFKSEVENKKRELDSELEETRQKLEATNQMLYEAQHIGSTRESEIEELRLQIHSYEEEMEGLRKDLKGSQGDKAAQMVEFEESLVKLEKEIATLKQKNEQLQDQVTNQSRQIEESREQSTLQSNQNDAHENAVKALIRKYEQQIMEKEEAFDNEQARIRDEAETRLKKTIHEFNIQIADLRQELFEKSALYDDVLERHQSELQAKQAELDQEVENCNRMYQTKLAELQAANEEKLGDLEQHYSKDFNSWNWERAASLDEDAVEDLQRTPTREQRELQLRQAAFSPPATLTLNVTSNHGCNHTHSLEEATEFEYLKNVLYQYMIGKESFTLARVLATVVKFTPDELREVLKHEEKRRSVFASLGLLQH